MLEKLISRLVYGPEPPSEPFAPKHLLEKKGLSPGEALLLARKEVSGMGRVATEMVWNIIETFKRKDMLFVEAVYLEDRKLIALDGAILQYLTSIPLEKLSDADRGEERTLLTLVNELKLTGSVVAREIMPQAARFCEEDLFFSPEGWEDVVRYHKKVYEGLKRALEAFADKDLEKAKGIAEEKVERVREGNALHWEHMKRLHKGLTESLTTSSIYLDLLHNLKRINSFATNVAYAVLEAGQGRFGGTT